MLATLLLIVNFDIGAAEKASFLANNVVAETESFTVQSSISGEVVQTSVLDDLVDLLPSNPFARVIANETVKTNQTDLAPAAVSGYRSKEYVDSITEDMQFAYGESGTAQAGISACTLFSPSSCWGFSICSGKIYLKSMSGTADPYTSYFSNSRLPESFKSIDGYDFIFENIQELSANADACGQACDKDSSCVAFTVLANTCWTKRLHSSSLCTAYIQ
jgi:hypothetical protein